MRWSQTSSHSRTGMRITFVLLFLFFDVLLALPFPGQNLLPKLHDEPGQLVRSGEVGGLVARDGSKPILDTSKVQFDQCTDKQEKEIKEAVVIAARYIKNALAYLKKLDTESSEYVKWFGAVEHRRCGWVKTVYELVQKNLVHTKYDCHTCAKETNVRPTTVAYVYSRKRDIPPVIHLCKPFWEWMPLEGLRSKASTIIHELSHFDMHGGIHHEGLTEEMIPNQIESGVLKAAKDDPQACIHNAYAYEMFAASVPNAVA